jgi:iron complex outermembrane receptor protein
MLLFGALGNGLLAQGDNANEEVFELSPFVVDTTADGYRVEQASTGTLVAMGLKEVPMDVTVLDESLLEDAGLYNADDLGKLVASVSQNETANTNGGGGNTVYNVRGFRSVPRRNGFAPGGRLYDMTGVQRVEIIKGPNSVLYGQTDPGGIINFVPKRPLFKQRANTSLVVGTNKHLRFKGDVTGPIGKSKRFAYRVPASYREYQREFDFFKWERFVVAPSFLARFGRTTEIVIEGEYIRQNVNLADMGPWQQNVDGLRIWDLDRQGLGRDFNRRGPFTESQNTQRNLTAELTTKLTDDITIRAMWTWNERDTKVDDILVDNINPRFLREPPLMNRAFVSRPENYIEGYKVDLLWEKNFWGIESKTVLGYERNRNRFEVIRYNSGLSGNSRFIIGPIPNPLNGDEVVASAWEPTIPWGIFLLNEPMDEVSAEHQLFRNRANQSLWHNLRLTETMHLMDDRLIVLGGVARGDVERQTLYMENDPNPGIPEDRDDTVYTLGGTYRLTPQVGLFANTSTSFIPVYRTGLDGTPLEPQTGVGFEFGTKLNLFDDALFATITYFDITNEGAPNQLPAEPENGIDEAYWVNAGEQQAKGIEIELNWNVTSQLEIFASFVAFNGEITRDLQFPDRVGLPLTKSPETSAQLTVNYRFAKDGPLGGLRVGGVIIHKGKSYQNATGQIGLVNEAYTIGNVFGRYRLSWGKETDIFFNVKNITDEEYLNTGGGYGFPRQIDFGTSMRF